MNNNKIVTVAILGAGPSGIVSAKEALENDLTPTVFEKHEDLGGVWDLKNGCVWPTMHTNISKFTTVFGDTQYPNDTEMFPTAVSVFQYLKDYANHWDIIKHIKFQTEVVNVEPEGDNGWTVTWKNANGQIESQIFSGVIVCTGIFAKQSIPNIPGLDSFQGKILHSKDYKNGKDFEGLTVLSIGGSFSGAEVAADVSKYANQCVHSYRRPFWILNRYLSNGKNAKIPVDLLFYNRKFYDEEKSKLEETEVNIKKNKGLAFLCKEQQECDELRVPEEEFMKPINVTISNDYLPQLKKGKLVPVLDTIKEITEGRKINFSSGKIVENVDAIIFGTGFQMDNSFFPQNILRTLKYKPEDRLQPLILFQEVLHPELKNLFFVGMYKGPYYGVIEQQARWASRLLAGKIDYPSNEIILEGLNKENEIREQVPRPQFPHPEYVLFADTIATFAKSFPDLDKLRSENFSLADTLFSSSSLFREPCSPSTIAILEGRKKEIAEKFMTAPVIPAHYNLVQNPRETLNQMDLVDQLIKFS